MYSMHIADKYNGKLCKNCHCTQASVTLSIFCFFFIRFFALFVISLNVVFIEFLRVDQLGFGRFFGSRLYFFSIDLVLCMLKHTFMIHILNVSQSMHSKHFSCIRTLTLAIRRKIVNNAKIYKIRSSSGT